MEEGEHKEKNQPGGHFSRSDVTAPPYRGRSNIWAGVAR